MLFRSCLFYLPTFMAQLFFICHSFNGSKVQKKSPKTGPQNTSFQSVDHLLKLPELVTCPQCYGLECRTKMTQLVFVIEVQSSPPHGGLVCALRFPSGISRNHSDSTRILIGNSGTQYHPNSREFVKSVRPDSDWTTRNYFRPVSDQNQVVPSGSDQNNSDKSLILIDHLI